MEKCFRCREAIGDEAAAEILVTDVMARDDEVSAGTFVIVHADTCLVASDVLA